MNSDCGLPITFSPKRTAKEKIMAKGQKRSNRELRKPKAEKSKAKGLPPISKARSEKPALLQKN